MPIESVDKNQQQSACTAKSKQGTLHGCSFLAASAISVLGMTLLAATVLVHFLLLTSVARNGEYDKYYVLFAPLIAAREANKPKSTKMHALKSYLTLL